MPEEVGGQPFPDGEEPDEEHHGEADEEFASVVFDEDFVRGAEVHEPTAAERMLAAAQSHHDNEIPHPYDDGYVYGPPGDGLYTGLDPDDDGTTHGFGYGYEQRRGGVHPHHEDYADEDHSYDDDHGPEDDDTDDHPVAPRPYRGHARWQRPVAWVLAVAMGVGVVALAFAAVYRGTAGQRGDPAPPPATTGLGAPAEALGDGP